MTITYRVGSGLYINMTNRCTNRCEFCIRNFSNSVGDTDSLWLEREPSRDEMQNDLLRHSMADYSEVVFCGYGEPAERLDDLLWLCGRLKQMGCPPIRVNTNGHASIIAGYDTAPRFAGLVDRLSISLNAAGADEYFALCNPVFGIEAYQEVIEFAKKVKNYVPDVVLSIVGGTTDTEACRAVAKAMGLPLRIR